MNVPDPPVKVVRAHDLHKKEDVKSKDPLYISFEISPV